MDYRDAGLSLSEYSKIKEILGREPNELEMALIGVMWSEHCSYKSTRRLLARFPQHGKQLVRGAGENAGVVDCHGGWGLAFKVESHNHPSAVAPYHGAATGVGGVIRDILAMGARPAASMDGLFLGMPDSEKSRALTEEIIKGIAGYGNVVGVPTIGGKTFYDPCFEDNPLVNAFNCGFVRLDGIASAQSARPGNKAVLLGLKTGRDGIAGASFASKELEEGGSESPVNVPIGDPFKEKLLIECCLELLEHGLIVSMQDMGAAGILSSSSEIAHKSGTGIRIVCEDIPLREEMEPWEIFLSESQERMLLIVEKNRFGDVKAVANRYDLECAIVGTMTDDRRYSVERGGEVIADLPVGILGDTPAIDWPTRPPGDLEERRRIPSDLRSADPAADLLSLVGSFHGSSRDEIWTQCDCQAATEPGEPVSAIPIPGSDSLVAFAMEAEPWKCHADAKSGAMETMAASIRALAVFGAEVLGMTNCLNFPSPENPENYFVLSECVDGLAEVCRDMECPVVSGNVSLYNETPKGGIYPTPLVVSVGFVSNCANIVRCGQARDGDEIYLVGPVTGSLGASRWQVLCGEPGRMIPRGSTWKYDAAMERGFVERALRLSRTADLRKSARLLAGGGLAVALARETICAGVGMTTDISGYDATEAMFSEGGPRAIYIIPPSGSEQFLACWDGYPVTKLGVMGGSSLIVKDVLDVSCKDLRDAYSRTAWENGEES
ncbi:MAG: phosphoribosylformylglycinamidine synthase subunit PurL [Synergistaceae bacterium]|nr:phosphoribosylformylglycinamidine synthase subunit PurL [Synergistaceae bacterium]